MALLACPSCRKRISTNAQSCPNCGEPLEAGWVEEQRRKSRMTTFGWIIGIIVVIAIAAANNGTENTSPGAPAQATTLPEKPLTPAEQKALAAKRAIEEAKAAPEKFLKLTSTSATKGGFDTVMILSGTVRNTSPIKVKDPEIECHIFSETKTVLGSVTETIFKEIPAGASVRFADERMGFANSRWQFYSCEVVSATPLVN